MMARQFVSSAGYTNCTHEGRKKCPINAVVNTKHTTLIGSPDNSNNPDSSGGRWLGAAWIGLLAVTLFGYPLCLDIPFLDPDEGLHAAIAQEMVESGDYVMPHLLGDSFSDKP